MRNKLFLLLISFIFIFTCSCSNKNEEIVILYENDVHCAVDGYSKLAALKEEFKTDTNYVGVVSSGDYIQGGSLGIVSKGQYIVEIMNLVGYDAVTLGNHEFDYTISRLDELVNMMNTKPISCNFQKIGEEKSYYEPYSIVSYGKTDIAYIGITTPQTINFASPAQFKDENGDFIYTFNVDTLYEVVQNNIDSAKKEGADYIVALSHIGIEEIPSTDNVLDLIANTSGLDVVLDAHSHSVIPHEKVKDKKGNDVILTSTGTKFEHVGKMTINGDEIETELIELESYEKTNLIVDQYLEGMYDNYLEIGNRVVGYSEVELIVEDEDGNRIIRNTETNLGNLCADAFYNISNADIAYINGGSIRKTISKGNITFNDLLNVFPYNNQLVVCEISGQKILDMLEFAMISYPNEDGSFPHLAGIKFSFNSSIPCSIIVDENNLFVEVDGEYRVHDVLVYDKATNEYKPLDLNKTYTLTATNYFILEQGSGMSMFKDVKIIENTGILDVEVFEKFVTENLNGIIGNEYLNVRNNIKIEA